MNSRKFQVAMLVIMISLSLMAITASCQNSNVKQDGFNYHTVEIQGMTCIEREHPISGKGGLTCNWDEWEGKVD